MTRKQNTMIGEMDRLHTQPKSYSSFRKQNSTRKLLEVYGWKQRGKSNSGGEAFETKVRRGLCGTRKETSLFCTKSCARYWHYFFLLLKPPRMTHKGLTPKVTQQSQGSNWYLPGSKPRSFPLQGQGQGWGWGRAT